MPSRRFRWLVVKEFRELLASRAFWLLLVMIGPLVGHGFITAVDTYAEASGIGGGPAALAQGLSPLDGIFVPAFGAYDLAVDAALPLRRHPPGGGREGQRRMETAAAIAGVIRRHAACEGTDSAGGMADCLDSGTLRAGALEALRRNDLRARAVESSAGASAARRAGRWVGGRGRRDRQRSGLCGHRDAGFYGGYVGAGIHRRRTRRRVGEARLLHSHVRVAYIRAGTVPARHGAGYRRHRDRRICARLHMAPRRAHCAGALPGVRRHCCWSSLSAWSPPRACAPPGTSARIAATASRPPTKRRSPAYASPCALPSFCRPKIRA